MTDSNIVDSDELFDRMLDYFDSEYTGLIPPNQALKHITLEYLDSLGPGSRTHPRVVEQRLLGMVNNIFALDNGNRAPGNKTPLIRHLTPYQIAQCLLRLHHVVRIAPTNRDTNREYDLLGMYCTAGPNRGVYTTSEDDIRTVARLYDTSLSIGGFNEVLQILKEDSKRTHQCEDPDLIAVNNGVFNYTTKELQSFTPDLVFLSKSHVDYNPDAESPVITHPVDGSVWEIEEWMRTLSDDPEVVDLLWEILGAIIRPHVRWHKAAFFYSETGNNGKGTLCELMRCLTGPSAYTSIPLSDLGSDFALEPLVRASAIIVDENDVGLFIDKAANFKAIVTNDVIQINRKYRTPIAYQFWGFMVQCLNEFPRVKDKSGSLYRRQLFVPFTKCFTGAERKYIKDDYLHRREVLEYVLKRVLHMNYYSLSEPVATKEVLAEYMEFNDPVRSWWEEFRDRFVWDLVPFTFGYELYRAWFADTSPSGSPVSRNVFIADLCSIVRTDAEWFCADKNRKLRPGASMSAPEPLIAEYDLKKWLNPHYKGSDPLKRSQPVLAASYRGIQRTVPIATTTATTTAAAPAPASSED